MVRRSCWERGGGNTESKQVKKRKGNAHVSRDPLTENVVSFGRCHTPHGVRAWRVEAHAFFDDGHQVGHFGRTAHVDLGFAAECVEDVGGEFVLDAGVLGKEVDDCREDVGRRFGAGHDEEDGVGVDFIAGEGLKLPQHVWIGFFASAPGDMHGLPSPLLWCPLIVQGPVASCRRKCACPPSH